MGGAALGLDEIARAVVGVGGPRGLSFSLGIRSQATKTLAGDGTRHATLNTTTLA